MSIVVPVMNPAPSEHSQTTADPTSPAVPARCSGIPATMERCASGRVKVSWKEVLPMKPGASALTVIASGAELLGQTLRQTGIPAFAAA